MKSSDVYICICIWVPAWCVHAYIHTFEFECVRSLSIQIALLLTDYKSKSILMTRILYADGYLVQCIFSTLFSLALALSIACLIARCCWKLITLGFIHFHQKNSLNFCWNWIEIQLYLNAFSSLLFVCHLNIFIQIKKKHTNKKSWLFHTLTHRHRHTDEEKKTIRSRHTKWMTSHYLLSNVWACCVFFFASAVCHWINKHINTWFYFFGQLVPSNVFLLSIVWLKRFFCCMWNSQRQ